jgi:hypothetical protein
MRPGRDVGRLQPGAAPVRAVGRQGLLERREGVLPAGQAVQPEASVGAAAGEFGLARALRLAVDAGAEAAKAAGFVAAQRAVAPQAAELVEGAAAAVAGRQP